MISVPSQIPTSDSRIWIGPVWIRDLSRNELIELVSRPCGKPVFLANLNAHALNLALKSDEVAKAIRNADNCFCDGFGILLLARLFRLGRPKHRNTPPDFVDEIYARMHEAQLRVFLLGDEPAVVQKYAAQIEEHWPGLVAGHHHGFIFEDEMLQVKVMEDLRRARPDVVLLGMGMPRQELWLANNRADLPPAHYVSVGALFAWKIGQRKRGPRWATDIGLEWLFRLLKEPALMWRRYVIGLPEVFVRLIFWYARHNDYHQETL